MPKTSAISHTLLGRASSNQVSCRMGACARPEAQSYLHAHLRCEHHAVHRLPAPKRGIVCVDRSGGLAYCICVRACDDLGTHTLAKREPLLDLDGQRPLDPLGPLVCVQPQPGRPARARPADDDADKTPTVAQFVLTDPDPAHAHASHTSPPPSQAHSGHTSPPPSQAHASHISLPPLLPLPHHPGHPQTQTQPQKSACAAHKNGAQDAPTRKNGAAAAPAHAHVPKNATPKPNANPAAPHSHSRTAPPPDAHARDRRI
ncbi:hypothetical protein JB92DRAFT_3132153 [Gautieria morchelliformis]|nr:hypothetical protein JB92DRAFT_3132153 [Gautieria morchelliformis]